MALLEFLKDQTRLDKLNTDFATEGPALLLGIDLHPFIIVKDIFNIAIIILVIIITITNPSSGVDPVLDPWARDEGETATAEVSSRSCFFLTLILVNLCPHFFFLLLCLLPGFLLQVLRSLYLGSETKFSQANQDELIQLLSDVHVLAPLDRSTSCSSFSSCVYSSS